MGYGSLLRTRNASDPGPAVGSQDPRVIDLGRQPLIERIVGRSNLLPVRFLEAGAIASRSVGRVAIQYVNLPDAGLGTGFMVSSGVFITNNHVIGDKGFAKKLELHFNYQYALDGSTISTPTIYELDPESLFYTNKELDFTVVRVKARTVAPQGVTSTSSTSMAGEEFGFIPLGDRFFYSKGQLANVIQHPQGRPKEIALHENEIQKIHANVIRYTTDTEPGSSGSPVFNNSWQVVALHHSAGEQDPNTSKWINNEGIRIDKIMEHLKGVSPNVMPATVIRELGL